MLLKKEKQTGKEISFFSFFLIPVSKERGSSIVEVAFLVALVAAGCINSINSLGQASSSAFGNVSDRLAGSGMNGLPPPPPH